MTARASYCIDCGAQRDGSFCGSCGRRYPTSTPAAEARQPFSPAPVVVLNAGAQNAAAKLLIVSLVLGGGIWFITGMVDAQEDNACSVRVAQSAIDSLSGGTFENEDC